ncbi:MAG: serine hydrolase [Melioribacteraceae bacterium]|nr:serine hydrolase [Melioribacteraceae bacterium]
MLLSVVLISCSVSPYVYKNPKKTSDGLITGNLSEENIDSLLIHQMIDAVSSGEYDDIHSILISRNKKLLFEEYFAGYDMEMPHPMTSAAKIFVSAAVGLAIDMNSIKSVDDAVLDYFPMYTDIQNIDSNKLQLTIEDLLTMRCGYDCSYDAGYFSESCVEQMKKAPDPVKFLLDLPMVSKPGTEFIYNDASPILVSRIVYASSGLKIDEFEFEFLFKPLGINMRNFTGDLRPRDMLKIGLLYLNNGLWNGQRILPKEWIQKSTRAHIEHMNKYNLGYGYYWWNINFNYRSKTIRCFYAAGNGGQYIFVVPDLKLVTVFTGGNYNDYKDMSGPYYLMSRYILPSINMEPDIHPVNSKHSRESLKHEPDDSKPPLFIFDK